MISFSACFWTLAGVIAGGTHSLALRYSCDRASEWAPLMGLLRLVLIGGVLVVASLLGCLFSAFTGWLIGFGATLVIALVRIQ